MKNISPKTKSSSQKPSTDYILNKLTFLSICSFSRSLRQCISVLTVALYLHAYYLLLNTGKKMDQRTQFSTAILVHTYTHPELMTSVLINHRLTGQLTRKLGHLKKIHHFFAVLVICKRHISD